MNKPALWTRTNCMTRRWAVDFVNEFCDELGKMSGRCIDIGSGPCDVTVDLFLPKLDPKATLVCSDISEEMLAFAKKKYENNERLSFLKLDIQTRDLPKDMIEKFDHATSFYCIHWCQDMRQVFKNIYNLLRPGGTLVLALMTNHPGLDSYEVLAAMPRYQPYMKDVKKWLLLFQNAEQPHKTLKSLTRDVGFEVHHCSTRKESYRFDDQDAFAEHVLSVNPFIDRMPADLQKEYKQDLIKEFTENYIVFNKNNNNEHEYSVLCLIRAVVVHLSKPTEGNSK